MDKTWKLQRYNRKDYTEVVDFPVEIVGRDGVVRRYTFEDSIRLYQRRITFAPIRYRDGELVDAEVLHCRSRIDQLRRSYFHRYGWGTPDGAPEPADVFDDLAGEVAAFLCRVLQSDERPPVRFQRLGMQTEDSLSTWFLTEEHTDAGMILYVRRFSGDSADASRDAFFSTLRRLELATTHGGESERLLAFHHSVDCGFVLTGRAQDFPEALPNPSRAMVMPAIEATPTPWDEALELIRRGRHEEALGRCRTVVQEQPYHRRAYVAGAMVAMHLERPIDAEEFGMLGTRYFDDDPILHYYMGIARLEDGRSAGEVSVRRALELAPGLTAARAALLVQLIRRGAYDEAARLAVGDPDGATATLKTVLQLRRAWPIVGLLLAGLVALAVLLSPWLLLAALLPVVFLVALPFVLRRQVRVLRAEQHADEIRRGLKRLVREQPPIAN